MITGVGIGSIYLAKVVIKRRRDAKFQPKAIYSNKPGTMGDLKNKDPSVSYYENLAQVKPGFPIHKDGEDKVPARKSKYEASGLSAVTRKRGDKLGFLDRRRNE